MMVPVLDNGYVRLVNQMGTELDIVNAARVSYDKEVDELEDRDKRLIKFLIEHHHDSTLRHNVMTFEVYAPLMVARQWWKHAVGSSHVEDQVGWNESSRRYVTENEEFYIPAWNEWRYAADNNKQGSSDKEMDKDLGVQLTLLMEKHIDKSMEIYETALKKGVAPEMARLFLPAYSLYVRWRWTASLNAVINFLDLRLGHTAQSEIQDYAEAVEKLVSANYPTVMEVVRNR